MSDHVDDPDTFVELGDEGDEGNRSRLTELLKAGNDGFVRESYRLPLATVESLTLTVGGRDFEILDLGLGGVRFVLDKRDRFTIGDTLSEIILPLSDKSLTVSGEVVHVSLGPDKTPQCGVRFDFGSDQDQQALSAFIQGVMATMFE